MTIKKIKQWIALVCSVFLIGSAAGCKGCKGCKEEVKVNALDYSGYDHTFDFYGYRTVSDGRYTQGGIEYFTGEDYRTKEHYQTYKDCGFTIFFPQSTLQYYTEDWETSAAKKAMDDCHEIGMEKYIIDDALLKNMSTSKTDKIGEGLQFENEAALDAWVEDRMSAYIDHPVFYGVTYFDEPTTEIMERQMYGAVYRSIKRVHPEVKIVANLLPFYENDKRFPDVPEDFVGTEEEIECERYRLYLQKFLDVTGADSIQVDIYPMQENDIYVRYLQSLQIIAEVCKENNAEMYMVTQSFGADYLSVRQVKEEDSRWLNNTLLGFGVKEISYYTYFPDEVSDFHLDGKSFLTRLGEKTDIWYNSQKIMAENQKFAPTIKNFDYVTCATYTVLPSFYQNSHATKVKNGTFTKLTSVSINKECALVTELYDDENQNYMYMVQNIVDPQNLGSGCYQTATLTFSSEYDYALIYENGISRTEKLKDGQLIVKHNPGEASYIIPFKNK